MHRFSPSALAKWLDLSLLVALIKLKQLQQYQEKVLTTHIHRLITRYIYKLFSISASAADTSRAGRLVLLQTCQVVSTQLNKIECLYHSVLFW